MQKLKLSRCQPMTEGLDAIEQQPTPILSSKRKIRKPHRLGETSSSDDELYTPKFNAKHAVKVFEKPPTNYVKSTAKADVLVDSTDSDITFSQDFTQSVITQTNTANYCCFSPHNYHIKKQSKVMHGSKSNALHQQHSVSCCDACQADIQIIKRKLNAIYLLTLDLTNHVPQDSVKLSFNLPITTEKELEDLEKLLKRDDVACAQLVSNFSFHLRIILFSLYYYCIGLQDQICFALHTKTSMLYYAS